MTLLIFIEDPDRAGEYKFERFRGPLPQVGDHIEIEEETVSDDDDSPATFLVLQRVLTLTHKAEVSTVRLKVRQDEP